MIEFTHDKTGNVYLYAGVGKMKDAATGEWMDCIFDTRKGHTQAREISDFFYNFTVIPQNSAILEEMNYESNIQQSNPS